MSKYTFRNSTYEEISVLEENGCKMYGIDCTDENILIFFGKMRTVFGEPHYVTDDGKYMQYWITAEDGQNKIYFSVVHDSSGTPVDIQNTICFIIYNASGDTSFIDELITLIGSIEPSDYEWNGVNVTFR